VQCDYFHNGIIGIDDISPLDGIPVNHRDKVRWVPAFQKPAFQKTMFIQVAAGFFLIQKNAGPAIPFSGNFYKLHGNRLKAVLQRIIRHFSCPDCNKMHVAGISGKKDFFVLPV
jgi:hypothetical protein